MTDTDVASEQALNDFLGKMQKGGRPVRMLGDGHVEDIDAIPTGALSLDIALGIGGVPRGRITELYGPESSGKTSMTLSIAAEAQKMGLNVAFIDAEHSLSRSHAIAYGVDLGALAFYQPDSGEDALQMAVEMAESGAFALIIIDSVAALTPIAELEGNMDDLQVGAQARMMGKGMRKLAGGCKRTNTGVLLINQIREKVGVMMGNPEVTPGGRALKFFASVRMDVRSAAGDRFREDGKRATSKDEPVGQTCRVKVKKNKCAPPMKRAEFKILYDTGIDAASGVLDAAKETGVIYTRGASYYRVGGTDRIALGEPEMISVLGADPDLRDEVAAQVWGAIRGELVIVENDEGHMVVATQDDLDAAA